MEENIFQKRLLQSMKKKGFTQIRLSYELGVTNATVSGWCRGLTYPSCYMLPAICRSLGVSADYLIGLKDR